MYCCYFLIEEAPKIGRLSPRVETQPIQVIIGQGANKKAKLIDCLHDLAIKRPILRDTIVPINCEQKWFPPEFDDSDDDDETRAEHERIIVDGLERLAAGLNPNKTE